MSDLSVRLSRFRPESPRWREAIAESPALIGVAGATFLAALPFLRDYRVGGAVALLVVASVVPVVIALACSVIWRLAAGFGYTLSAVGLVLVLLFYMGPHPGVVTAGIGQGTQPAVDPNSSPGRGQGHDGGRRGADVALRHDCIRNADPGPAPRIRALDDRSDRAGRAVRPVLRRRHASAPGSDRAVGPLLLVVLAAIAVARHRETEAAIVSVEGGTGDEPEKSPPKYRGVVAGAVIAIGVTAVAALVIAAVPSSGRKPASLHRAAPTATTVLVDPVDSMAQLRDGNPHGPASRELAVDLSRASTGYLGMAILDDYDGAVWQFTATFGPTGGRIPDAGAAGPAPLDNSTVTQHVILEGQLPIALLPALDRPAAVAGVSIAADPATGMFLPVSAKNGLLTYTAVSRAPEVTIEGVPPADAVASASSPGVSISQGDLELPAGTSSALATTLRFLSSLTGERPAPSVAFLQSVVDALHANEKRVDPSLVSVSTPLAKPRPEPTRGPAASSKAKVTGRSPGQAGRATRRAPARTTTTTVPASAKAIGGTSLSAAINAVTVNRSATPEQFATLVAMVARYLGVPARVVTGFRCAPDLRRPCHRAGQLPGDRPSGLDVGGDSRGRPGLGRCRPHA